MLLYLELFVSDLRQVLVSSSFSSNKIDRHDITESGAKHHKPRPSIWNNYPHYSLTIL